MSVYLQPRSLEELIPILAMMTENGAVLAGGTDLLPRLRETGRKPDIILSLCKLPGLRQIDASPDGLRIGAMVTHAQIVAHPAVRQHYSALALACASVGSQQIRNKATLVGNLATASPAGDTIPCCYLFNAQVELLSPQGLRRMPIATFITGAKQTILRPREIIKAVLLPPQRGGSWFYKLGNRSAVSRARFIVTASWKAIKDDACLEARLFVGAIAAQPLNIPEAAAILAAPLDSVASGDALWQAIADKLPPRKTNLYKAAAARGVARDFVNGVMRQIGQATKRDPLGIEPTNGR